jgi:hypothetical protein
VTIIAEMEGEIAGAVLGCGTAAGHPPLRPPVSV